jgi:hypothetical protein
MFSGRQRDLYNNSRHVEEEMDDEEYNLQDYEDVGADVASDVAPTLRADGKHASVEMFENPQKITFDVNIVGSPEQLAQGIVSDKWSLKEELLKRLKHNTALADRLNATEDDLKGDLRQCVPLSFEVVEHGNSFPYAMAFNVPGVMPLTISEHGAWVHRTAAKTPVTPTNGAVRFEPTNVIDRALLARSQQTTRSDLDNDVKLEKDYGMVKVNSPAYFKMVDALEAGEWQDVPMSEEEYMSIVEPSTHARVVQVPRAIASTLRENLAGPIDEFLKRCINLQDFEIKVERADGNPEFNSPKGYVGEQIGADIDPEDELPHEASNTCQQYHAKCTLSFCLSSK